MNFLVQGSYNFGIRNINPNMAASLPSGSSSVMVMPPILGTYTSLMFQVQQNSVGRSNSTELHFNGSARLNDTMDHMIWCNLKVLDVAFFALGNCDLF
jgi:hypothetical protein